MNSLSLTAMKLLCLTALLILPALAGEAQMLMRPRTPALDLVSARYKDTYIKVTYSQPVKTTSPVFGQQVPFGKVWATGANEAAEITITKNIQINNVLLKAGTYSLFTIPGPEKWTIIINSDVGLWGAYNYNERQDVMRFEVPVQAVQQMVYELFTLQFDQRNDVADLLLLWDKVRITIPIKFLN